MKRKLPKISKPSFRGGKGKKAKEAPEAPASSAVPRITNETVAEHREEVLSSARKYVYPLSHSKHRVILISIWLVVGAVVAFFIYCGLAFYKFQTTSSFAYGVSQVIPFPVAKAGPDFVSYESYLFELRHYIHYYQTQQQVDFNSKSGQQQLDSFKQQALNQVIDDSFVKQLARQHHISVSDQDVNNEVALVRSQNRLGSNTQVFQDVLQNFWGWSIDDFKRELKQQLLAQKVVAELDTGTQQRARQALDQLNHGAQFDKLAAKVSDDTSTKKAGGEYGGWISESNRDIAPEVAEALFKLQPGHYSGIIDTGYSLEIVKVLERKGDQVRAAHISFNLNDISTYINPLKAHETIHRYINVGS